jgi:hypothetical protein
MDINQTIPQFQHQVPPAPLATPRSYPSPPPRSNVQTLGTPGQMATNLPLPPTPRIGGLLPNCSMGEPWTGGSNIQPPMMPNYLLQCHPQKYGSFQALLDEIGKGSKDKLGLNEEKSDCTFQLGLNKIK